jgi:hypothetical protein
LLYFVDRVAGGAGWVGRRRRGPAPGVLRSGCRCGEARYITFGCAPRNWSKAETQARRNEHRRRSRSFMPSAERSEVKSAGSRFRFCAGSRDAKRASRRASTVRIACLRRLQTAERNGAKKPASGAVRWRLRSGVACSGLKRRSQAFSASAVCESISAGPDAQVTHHTSHRAS